MHFVECTVLGSPIEYPDRNWRNARRKTEDGLRDQIRAERAKGKPVPYDIGGQLWFACDMDDDEIDYVARRKAEMLTEESINRHESTQIRHRVKDRRGLAK